MLKHNLEIQAYALAAAKGRARYFVPFCGHATGQEKRARKVITLRALE